MSRIEPGQSHLAPQLTLLRRGAHSNEREIVAGGERFGTGKPQARFAQLAAKSMRHKI